MSNWPTNGGSCSSSNLSAFAPPFTIPQLDPYPNSIPFYVDSVQPPFDQGPVNSSHNTWVNPCPPNARTDWFPASNLELDIGTYLNAYGYSGVETVNGENVPLPSWNSVDVGLNDKFGRRCDALRRTVMESDTCYPFYGSSGGVQGAPSGLASQCDYGRISSPFDANFDKLPHDDQSKSVSSGDAAESSGLWNEHPLRHHGKSEEIGGSYCLKEPIAAPLITETCPNGGSHSDGLLSWEKHGGFLSGKHVDASNSSLDLPRVFHETHPRAAIPELSSNLGKKQWPYAHIDENVAVNHVSSAYGGNMILESFAAPQMGPPADGFVSGTGEVLLGGQTKGRHSANEYYAGVILSSVNEPQSLQGSELPLDGTNLGKGGLKRGSFMNDGNSVVKSMPAPTMGFPIDGFRPRTGEVSIGDHENGRDRANELYAGVMLSNVNEPWSVQAFGSKSQLDSTSLGKGVLQHGSSVNDGDSVAKLLPATTIGFPIDGFSPQTGEVTVGDRKNSANELYAHLILSNANEPLSVQAFGSRSRFDGTSLGKSVSQHDSSVNDGNCDVKPLLAHTVGSSFDGFSSRAGEFSTGDHKDGRDFANECYASILLSSVNKPPLVRACGSESLFDTADLGIHLGSSDFTFEEPRHPEDDDWSNGKRDSKDAFRHLAGANFGFEDSLTLDQFKLALEHNRTMQFAEKHIVAKSGSGNPYVTLDRFSLPSKVNNALNSAGSPSVGLCQFEHAVDSPCWKEAIAHPKHGEEPELSGIDLLQDLRIVGNTLYPTKVSSDKPRAGKVLYKGGCSNRTSMSPSVLHAFVNPSGREGRSNDTEDICLSDLEHVPFSNDDGESTGHCIMCQESIGDSSAKPSHPTQQSSGEGDVTSDKGHMPTHHVSDVSTNENDSLKMDPPAGLLLSMKHVLESTTAVDNSPGLANWDRGSVIPKMDGQMLVSTLHNLSELLLYSCLSGAYDLKERETDVIQKVIDNLCACSSKNVEQMTTQPKIHNSEEHTYRCFGASPDLDMSASTNIPPVASAFSVNIPSQIDNHCAIDKKRQHTGFDNEDGSSSELSSSRDNALIYKDDAMTQAIKKILSENFEVKDDSQPQIGLFKNLWLEAEATLCSMNYKARFNRMKIEMDKSRSKELKDSLGNTLDVENSSDIGVSIQSNEDDKLLVGTRSCEKPEKLNALVQSPTVVSTIGSTIDPTNNLLALSCRPHNSSTESTPDVEEQGPLKVSPGLSRTAELTAGTSKENGSLAPEISLSSPVTGAIFCTDDVEASVMARLKILKRWDESLSSENQTQIPPDSVDLGLALKEDRFPVARENLTEESTNLSGGKLKMESRGGVGDSQILHSRTKDELKNPLSAGWHDCSSDWEHVLKEEILGRDIEP
ncbi:uncharacterized protein LOC115726819 isoform X2 [Rhodamnia argentea]|uniref:Uncharacterized protein LOC115726819 isoform X2 n=1 Tax=Rhodamnia argentea TaxID=178133 RepID=A0A8B8MQ78_9MYRT|nr:uncharacterized protein LOC115726819 isoform X2 [Rhodamnia argentea]